MSFMFHKRTKKVMKWVWIVLAILIMLSMILLFSPGLLPTPSAATPVPF